MYRSLLANVSENRVQAGLLGVHLFGDFGEDEWRPVAVGRSGVESSIFYRSSIDRRRNQSVTIELIADSGNCRSIPCQNLFELTAGGFKGNDGVAEWIERHHVAVSDRTLHERRADSAQVFQVEFETELFPNGVGDHVVFRPVRPS